MAAQPPLPTDYGWKHQRHDRKLLNNITVDDPLQIIALAVQFDERREDFLRHPLELGSFYDNVQFARALEFLQQKQPTTNCNTAPNEPVLPDYAVTPIILGGILTASSKKKNAANNNNALPDTSRCDLVMSCQAMRTAALSRIHARHRRRRFLRVCIPAFVVFIGIAMYGRSAATTMHVLMDLQFIKDSCWSHNDDIYEYSCRRSEAELWEHFGDYVTTLHADARGQQKVPLAMHTLLFRSLITLQDVDRTITSNKVIAPSRRIETHVPQHLQNRWWMGESTVNRLVREVIHQFIGNETKGLKVLDVGCGVGGTLYSLLPDNNQKQQTFTYHGIAISGSEIYHAKKIAEHHGLVNATFSQQSFDTPDANTYTLIVAIESLSSSRNLRATIRNLMASLRPGGVFVAVDHVALPSYEEDRLAMPRQPSIVINSYWLDSLEEANCKVEVVRDLGLEYELGFSSGGRSSLLPLWRYGIKWVPWLAFYGATNNAARRMIQLHKDRLDLTKARSKRKKEYDKVAMAYHMYVCVKQ